MWHLTKLVDFFLRHEGTFAIFLAVEGVFLPVKGKRLKLTTDGFKLAADY
ncbi:hypothetical protein MuYL_0470 [Mucilaginibacter xinganensis]|uniref:Uncharacterized protein n=1 Tax=Mucilaginibacter xinganensis TaxID=1234841 RepID=A0A223NR84_9SPHI|nr:hypothetical protein MuYL_0470 [Mucilaginibacter xinganensis]